MLLLLSLLISCSNGSNDLDRSGIKGNVKSTKEQQFEATYENDHWVAGDPNPMGVRIVNYDVNGFYVESIALSIHGDTIGISKGKRENGEMVEDNYYSLLDGRTSRTLLERVADEQVNFEVWQDDQLIYEGANYFDGKGRIIKQVQVGGDREVTIHHVYEKNLLVENYREEISGERTASQQYEYDDFDDTGNWTVKLIYLGDEKITPKMVITRKLTYY
jgi:hypothetical protein